MTRNDALDREDQQRSPTGLRSQPRSSITEMPRTGNRAQPEQVEVAHHRVSIHGSHIQQPSLKIDPEKTKAVLEIPKPEDAEGVQRMNGFVNCFAKFLPSLANHMESIRRLTRQDTEFT